MVVRLTEVKYTPVETAALLRISRRTLDRWRDPEKAPLGIALEPMYVGPYAFYTEGIIADWQQQCDQRRKRLRQPPHKRAKVAR